MRSRRLHLSNYITIFISTNCILGYNSNLPYLNRCPAFTYVIFRLYIGKPHGKSNSAKILLWHWSLPLKLLSLKLRLLVSGFIVRLQFLKSFSSFVLYQPFLRFQVDLRVVYIAAIYAQQLLVMQLKSFGSFLGIDGDGICFFFTDGY